MAGRTGCSVCGLAVSLHVEAPSQPRTLENWLRRVGLRALAHNNSLVLKISRGTRVKAMRVDRLSFLLAWKIHPGPVAWLLFWSQFSPVLHRASASPRGFGSSNHDSLARLHAARRIATAQPSLRSTRQVILCTSRAMKCVPGVRSTFHVGAQDGVPRQQVLCGLCDARLSAAGARLSSMVE